MLGVLAALFLTAGLLPWLTGGTGTARLLAAPLAVIGAAAAYALVRSNRPQPVPVRAAGCGSCQCGTNAGCATAAE